MRIIDPKCGIERATRVGIISLIGFAASCGSPKSEGLSGEKSSAMGRLSGGQAILVQLEISDSPRVQGCNKTSVWTEVGYYNPLTRLAEQATKQQKEAEKAEKAKAGEADGASNSTKSGQSIGTSTLVDRSTVQVPASQFQLQEGGGATSAGVAGATGTAAPAGSPAGGPTSAPSGAPAQQAAAAQTPPSAVVEEADSEVKGLTAYQVCVGQDGVTTWTAQ